MSSARTKISAGRRSPMFPDFGPAEAGRETPKTEIELVDRPLREVVRIVMTGRQGFALGQDVEIVVKPPRNRHQVPALHVT